MPNGETTRVIEAEFDEFATDEDVISLIECMGKALWRSVTALRKAAKGNELKS
jgi:hypothetical protein